MESFEYFGWWWLPTDAGNKITGKLSFSDENGITLDLIGSFHGRVDFGFRAQENYPIILGTTTHGKIITLANCTEIKNEYNTNGISVQYLRSIQAYIGVHFNTEENIRFHKISMDFTHLREWALIAGFEIAITQENKKFSEYKAVYKDVEGLVVDMGSYIISIEYLFKFSLPIGQQLDARQDVVIIVEAANDFDFIEMLEKFVNPLQDLLTLATGEANSIKYLRAYNKEHKHTPDEWEIQYVKANNLDENELGYYHPIDIYFKQNYIEVSESKRLDRNSMLLTLHHIKENYSDIIRKWFEIQQDLESIFKVFFNPQYNNLQNHLIRFINVTQSLEIYSRIRGKNEIIPKFEYKTKVDNIIENVPKDEQLWLREKLGYSNNPTLKHRVEELLNIHSDIMSTLVRDNNAFAQKVAYTRNYYTHYSNSERAFRGANLYWCTEFLTILAKRCLLHEMGLTSEQVMKLFTDNEQYTSARSQAYRFDAQPAQ